jgi:hypothetical protein
MKRRETSQLGIPLLALASALAAVQPRAHASLLPADQETAAISEALVAEAHGYDCLSDLGDGLVAMWEPPPEAHGRCRIEDVEEAR